MAPGLTLREGGLVDAEVMAATVLTGFETYRAFAPRGWEPPPLEAELASQRARLGGPDAWALLAEIDDRPAGHVALLADPEPGSAYLWQLFVRPEHWGRGVAPILHTAFLEAARERGYGRARLRTPVGQARARAFYERRRWATDGLPAYEDGLGLELLVYTREALT